MAVAVGMVIRDAAAHMKTDLTVGEVVEGMVIAAQEASPVAIVSR